MNASKASSLRSKLALVASCAIVAALSNAASAADLPIPIETAWTKAMQSLALGGMTISASDQKAGVIQFDGEFGDRSEFFECPRAGGALIKRVYSGTLVLKANADGTTFAMIQVAGTERRYRNHHILFFTTGQADFESQCKTTGRFETAFIQRLVSA
jgi:hypothetical protein